MFKKTKVLAQICGFGVVLMMASAQADGKAMAWDLDPTHSHVGFVTTHAAISKVRGSFSDVTGKLSFDEQDISKSSVDISIDISSVYSGMSKRDDHLKSADFFDAEKYPQMRFKSNKVVKKGKNLEVTGDLTIKNTTKQVTLMVEGLDKKSKDPFGNIRLAASANTKIDRRDFGLTWNKPLEKAGELLVGNNVAIEIDVQFIAPKSDSTTAQN